MNWLCTIRAIPGSCQHLLLASQRCIGRGRLFFSGPIATIISTITPRPRRGTMTSGTGNMVSSSLHKGQIHDDGANASRCQFWPWIISMCSSHFCEVANLGDGSGHFSEMQRYGLWSSFTCTRWGQRSSKGNLLTCVVRD